MRIALTGGTGIVGRFLAEAALAAGHDLVLLGRRPAPEGLLSAPAGHLGYDLAGPAPDLRGQDAVIHAAFAHLPGRYRGGEGADPAGFLAANRDGSLRLFAAAAEAGARVVFLSSRAVYDGLPPGTLLTEDRTLAPDSLYGRMKAEVEAALPAGGLALRATGVYGPTGPGQVQKWAGLLADYLAGRAVEPRVATEVHGADLAAAALLLLGRPGAAGPYNVSDLVLDRHDLLAEVARLTGSAHPPPARAPAAGLGVMRCDRLAALGWRPGGWARLRADLPRILDAAAQPATSAGGQTRATYSR